MQLDCCGGAGPDDYMDSFFDNTTQDELPASCCVLTNRKAAEENPNEAIPEDVPGCQNKTSTQYYHNEVKYSLTCFKQPSIQVTWKPL